MTINLTKAGARAGLLAAVLALAACGQNGFGGFGGGGADATAAGVGAADPSSPEYFNQTIGDRVLFEVDQSTLTASAESVLRQQAQWLMQNPEFSALVEGHADEQGTREYNLALGARRASAARDFLVSQGVPDARLRTISYGKERPLEICSDETCYQQNRRAVTVLAIGAGA